MQESLSARLSIIAPVGHCIVHSSTYVGTHHLSGRPAAIMTIASTNQLMDVLVVLMSRRKLLQKIFIRSFDDSVVDVSKKYLF